MHKNWIWRAFLSVVFVVTLWYTGDAWYRYYAYSHLNAKTTADAVDWTIEKHSEDAYSLTASYRFTIGKTSYSGRTSFAKNYRNRWAAEQAVAEYSSSPWDVWYGKENPNHSSLQKSFPVKECVSAVVLWALLLYFLWLGFYVSKFKY